MDSLQSGLVRGKVYMGKKGRKKEGKGMIYGK